MESHEPIYQNLTSSSGSGLITVANQFSILPRRDYLLELDFQVAFCVWMRLLGRQCKIEVERSCQMVEVGQGDNCQLIMRGSWRRINKASQRVISFSRTPIALLRQRLRLPISGEVTEPNQSLVTGQKNSVTKLCRGLYWIICWEGYMLSIGIFGLLVPPHTAQLELMCNCFQFTYSAKIWG